MEEPSNEAVNEALDSVETASETQEPSESDPTQESTASDGTKQDQAIPEPPSIESGENTSSAESTPASVSITSAPLIWDGAIRVNKPASPELRKAFPGGNVMAKMSRNIHGNAYYDNANGKPMFFPNPSTYPRGGYLPGEEVPIGR